VPTHEFAAALVAGCVRVTEMLARDGEGATKLLRVSVAGAASEAEARCVARTIVNSPLIKTMAHGADPNVGRILMAIGKCFECTIRPDSTDATVNGTTVVSGGRRADFDEAAVRTALAADTVDIAVELGAGDGRAIAWGCDLSAGYVAENAAYYSS
jgi:glutamate N-acetyltransferase/amino-acid N-acetyltransferase